MHAEDKLVLGFVATLLLATTAVICGAVGYHRGFCDAREIMEKQAIAHGAAQYTQDMFAGRRMGEPGFEWTMPYASERELADFTRAPRP